MSKGYSGHFNGTLGTSFVNIGAKEKSYLDRGIDVPSEIKEALSKLKKNGDHITVNGEAFSMKDVSIMSKETGVEFAKVTMNGECILVRGDERSVVLDDELLAKMALHSGRFEFHSHPHNGDLIPSEKDIEMIKGLMKLTGQKSSCIVTPDGRISTFTIHGVVSTNTVSNSIDKSLRKTYLELFGG